VRVLTFAAMTFEGRFPIEVSKLFSRTRNALEREGHNEIFVESARVTTLKGYFKTDNRIDGK